MKTVIQSESSECSLACLSMVASYYGYHVSLSELRRKFSLSIKGAKLSDLMRYAENIHFSTRPVRAELDDIGALKLPCIIHWDLNHFVVLHSIESSWLKGDRICVADPAVGYRRLTIDEFSNHFTGIALELTPTAGFETKPPRAESRLSDLIGRVVGLRRAAFQVISLAAALEIFTLVQPLFNQFVVDDVLANGDMDLMLVMTLGFGLVLVSRTSIDMARSWLLMRWSIEISFQWASRIFSHLTRLPISYFEKRHLGDVVSRFSSIASIQSTLTSLLVESIIDGAMAILALLMMFLYSGLLSVIVLGAVVAYGVLRIALYPSLREGAQKKIEAAAKENSHFLETLRAIMPIKLFSREADRRASWSNLRVNVNNADVQLQRLNLIFRLANSFISGTQMLLVFYFGASLIVQNKLTVGMLMAFTTYSSTFSTRLFNLIDMSVDVKMLGMHADRLSDIVATPAEERAAIETDIQRIDASIILRNVRFRYGDGEPWILDGINIEIPAGQSVVFAGASGCGKTTLCKILIGLLEPTEGQVFIGGVPLKKLGFEAYRKMVGTVMQNDVLLAGSIAENIAFFDPDADISNVEKSAKLAAIHSEIVKFPMGYQSLVGDLGSSLSGGQKQRVLLARALYKRPAILALDEATSHLDLPNERKVTQSLSALSITRIAVAHRPESIKAADRVIMLDNGVISIDLLNQDGMTSAA